MKLAIGAGKLRYELGAALNGSALLAGLVPAMGICAISHFGQPVGAIVDVPIIQTLQPVGTRSSAALPMGNARGQDLVAICPRPDDLTQSLVNSISAVPFAMVEGHGGYGGYDHGPRSFARALNTATGHLAANDDQDLRTALAAALVDHAKRDAWTPAGELTPARWAITEAFATLIPAYNRLRRSMPEDDVALVDKWIADRLEDAEANINTNNQRAQHGANLAAFSHVVGQQAYADRALAIAREQIATLRNDGSLPLETERGRLALSYSSRTIASLVMIAEITGTRSLYDEGIDQAVRFLVNANADNSLVDGYAEANRHTPADLEWQPGAQVSPLEGGSGGWARLYDGASAQEVLALAAVEGRVNHDTVGGWLGCF